MVLFHIILIYSKAFIFQLLKFIYFNKEQKVFDMLFTVSLNKIMSIIFVRCLLLFYSTSLKNLLETLLAVGNYLNGATDMGQADGFGLEVLNKMKEIQDRVCSYTED